MVISTEKAQFNVHQCLILYNKFKQLIDSFVLDYYVQDHWSSLPNSWKEYFKDLEPNDLAELLAGSTKISKLPQKLMPLSILTLQKLLKLINLPRNEVHVNEIINNNLSLNENSKLAYDEDLINHPKLKNEFWRHVSPKKKHELLIMVQSVRELARIFDCNFIVDIGSGVGHFSRLLSYGFGFQVLGLECNQSFVLKARNYDNCLEAKASKFLPNLDLSTRRPTYVTHYIQCDSSFQSFLNLLKIFIHKKCKNGYTNVGIVGIHSCGDLASFLLHCFNYCNYIKFINLASCCYMKISIGLPFPGFPLSCFLKELKTNLSYNACELACHGIENYIFKLKNNDYIDLKTHAFRAMLEKLIIEYSPEKSHMPLANVKCTKNMNFHDYVIKATKGHENLFPMQLIHSEEIKNKLDEWKKVVIFYTLRLMFAPMIETIILLDRYLYLKENDIHCTVAPLFNPQLSPRNQIIIGIRD